MVVYSSLFLSLAIAENKFQKVKMEMKNGHFKNVQKRKPPKSFKNTPFFRIITIMVTIIIFG